MGQGHSVKDRCGGMVIDPHFGITYDVEAIEKLPVGLKPGDSAPGVVELQKYLKRYGYIDLAAVPKPGLIDEVTAAGLARFQEENMTGPPHGILDLRTKSTMVHERCAMPDGNEALRGRPRWAVFDLTYGFSDTACAGVDAAEFKKAVASAFETWKSAGAGFEFTEVATEAHPDILVGWVAAADQGCAGLGGRKVAHGAWPPPEGQHPAAALVVHFDREEHRWATGMLAGAFDVESVAVHEIGHCLGLGHITDPGAVMHNLMRTNSEKRNLSLLDVSALRGLYQKPQVIGLRPVGGDYVVLKNGRLQAAGREITSEGRFSVVLVGDSVEQQPRKIAIRAPNGRFLSASGGGGGEVTADRDWIKLWETFWLIPTTDRQYLIQTVGRGQFLEVSGDRVLRATGIRVETAGIFHVELLAS